jgi:hypothetical protein
VIQLLADVNIEGHVARLVALMQTEEWREIWEYLDIHPRTFRDVGLSADEFDFSVSSSSCTF